MEDNVGKLRAVWKSFEHKLSKDEQQISAQKIDEYLGAIFCPGPFYYYLMDFSKLEIVYMHPSIEDILGLSPEGVSLMDLSFRIHPEDQQHFIKCEQMASSFLFKQIKIHQIPLYKVSYCFRMRDRDNKYRLMLHQALTISVDDKGNIGKVIGVHSDISHFVNTNTHRISFIGLQGEPSYLGLEVKGEELDLQLEDKPFSKREMEIIRLLADGYSAQEVAERLYLSYHTIRTHRQNILKRLDCRNTVQLIAKCIRNGYI
ncbi:MAG: PAS domain-containing protein [Saprospiraceae bacterium]|nr:PAS domain-containing protein [Saprospiraceae bacterium]